jgi:hypothetical protein
MLYDLLPQVDDYLKRATGVDWSSIVPIPTAAKSAARMLLVKWFEDPGGMGDGEASLGFGLRSALVQLEVEAIRYKTFEGLSGAGWINISGAQVGDEVVSVTGILGATGDASASFATYIELEGALEQTSTSDLSGKFYRAYLKPLEDQ